MFIFSKEILPYIDFEDGKVIALRLPDELKEKFEKEKSHYYDLINDDDYTDY